MQWLRAKCYIADIAILYISIHWRLCPLNRYKQRPFHSAISQMRNSTLTPHPVHYDCSALAHLLCCSMTCHVWIPSEVLFARLVVYLLCSLPDWKGLGRLLQVLVKLDLCYYRRCSNGRLRAKQQKGGYVWYGAHWYLKNMQPLLYSLLWLLRTTLLWLMLLSLVRGSYFQYHNEVEAKRLIVSLFLLKILFIVLLVAQ